MLSVERIRQDVLEVVMGARRRRPVVATNLSDVVVVLPQVVAAVESAMKGAVRARGIDSGQVETTAVVVRFADTVIGMDPEGPDADRLQEVGWRVVVPELEPAVHPVVERRTVIERGELAAELVHGSLAPDARVFLERSVGSRSLGHQPELRTAADHQPGDRDPAPPEECSPGEAGAGCRAGVFAGTVGQGEPLVVARVVPRMHVRPSHARPRARFESTRRRKGNSQAPAKNPSPTDTPV